MLYLFGGCILLLCCVSVSHGEAASRPSRCIVDIDVNDEAIIRENPMTKQDVKDLVTELKENGCDTLLVRMGFLGLLPYRTDLSYPISFDIEHAKIHGKNTPIIDDLDAIIKRNIAWCERYSKAVEAFNPPEAFLEYGHKLGMKVVFWIDLFDDGFPGFHSKFIDEHPWCQWTARDGKTYFQGLISYAWPEARAFRVAQAKELLDLGADGIHCSTSAHCRHMMNVHENDFYGFEQPVVDEYKKRFGVDIRMVDNFDHEAWHDIKGEMMDQLYSELADVCHSRGKELWIGMQLGKYTHHCADPYDGDNVVVRYANHWKELTDRDIADAYIIADFEIPSRGKGQIYWQAKPDIKPLEGEDLFGWTAREYLPYCAGKTKVYLFGEWLPADEKQMEDTLTAWVERMEKYDFDGIDIHEAVIFEQINTFKPMGRFFDRIKK